MNMDYSFALFVVGMVVLFLALLLKRLCQKTPPADLRYDNWTTTEVSGNGRIQSISILVQQRGVPERTVRTATDEVLDDAWEQAPPPPFHVVVSDPKTPTSIVKDRDESAGQSDYELPPPSYEEYLATQEKPETVFLSSK